MDYQSLDFVESGGTASIATHRLRQRRVDQQTEMGAPRRALTSDRDYQLTDLVVIHTTSEPPAGLRESMIEIERVSALPPNWDGSGSPAPAKSSVLQAGELVGSLLFSLSETDPQWVAPHVSADERGEITFEWWNPAQGRKLTVYIGDKKLQYVKVWGARIDEDMEDGEFYSSQFAVAWRWLFAR